MPLCFLHPMGHVDSKAKFTRFRLFWAGSDHEATPKRPRSDHKATPERRGALPAPGRAGRHVRVVKRGVINQCRSDEILFWKRYVSGQSWPALRTKKGWRVPVDFESLRGIKMEYDFVNAKSGRVVHKAGTKLTPRLLRSLWRAQFKRLRRGVIVIRVAGGILFAPTFRTSRLFRSRDSAKVIKCQDFWILLRVVHVPPALSSGAIRFILTEYTHKNVVLVSTCWV